MRDEHSGAKSKNGHKFINKQDCLLKRLAPHPQKRVNKHGQRRPDQKQPKARARNIHGNHQL